MQQWEADNEIHILVDGVEFVADNSLVYRTEHGRFYAVINRLDFDEKIFGSYVGRRDTAWPNIHNETFGSLDDALQFAANSLNKLKETA